MEYNIVVVICLYMVIKWTSADQNPCEAAATCTDCMTADPDCKWCADPDYTSKDATIPRCKTKWKLEQLKCKDIQIDDGRILVSDDEFSATTQVKPNKVTIKLRPGQTQAFTLSVKPAKNYPVRLYYLMDLSNSMKDDLKNLKTLGTKIANALKNITNNYQLAFGTFVDKSVAPFIQLAQKDEPCQGCEATFGYKHVFDFNKDARLFEAAVGRERISGNLDAPEGGFDALIQLAVCGDEIWPKGEISRKIVVFVTDASPHIAGDGKLGGIVEPNDGQCHLTARNSKGFRFYSKTNDLDYPSISLLKAKLKENKLIPIFAVTSDVEPIYKKLAEEWKDLGTGLGSIERDSSNIVDLIRENYMRISTTVRLNDNSPGNLVVKYKVSGGCTATRGDNECTGVAIDQRVDFRVLVTATNCPNEWKNGTRFTINVPSFGGVEVNVEYICECACSKGGIPASPKCDDRGTLKCGICHCDKGRLGKNCECGRDSHTGTSLCIMPDATNNAVCSGFGSCVCGKCECTDFNDPRKKVEGTYCQCNNFGCDRYNGKLCGGPERGICKCGRCVCNEGYLGGNCGRRKCQTQQCVKDGVVCSGNGKCACDLCECNTGYKGQFCDVCVSCQGKCTGNKACVLCHAPYKRGDERQCKECKLQVVLVNGTRGQGEDQCSVYLTTTCRVYFNFDKDITGNEVVYVENEARCVIIVVAGVPILPIIIGIGSAVAATIIALGIWKITTHTIDMHRYRRFREDQANRIMPQFVRRESKDAFGEESSDSRTSTISKESTKYL